MSEPNNIKIDAVSWKPLFRIMVAVTALLVVLAVARLLSDLAQTLLVSLFLAISADAVARRVQRMGVTRGKSIAIVLISGVAAGVMIVLMLIPPLIKEGAQLAAEAPEIVAEVEKSEAYKDITDTFNISATLADSLKKVLLEIPEVLVDFLSNLVDGIFGLVTILIAVAFLMTSGDRALGLAFKLIPRLSTVNGWEVVIGAYNNIGRYVVGASMQALFAGTSLALVLLVLDVPYALPLGVFMFVMDFIPLVGATIGTIPAVAVALFAGGWFEGITVCAFLIVYQQIENSVIQPRIQEKVVKLPGIAIFFSCLVGGQLLGVLGALIAVPVASIVQIVINQYLVYTGRDQLEMPKLFDHKGEAIMERLGGDPPGPTTAG